MARGEEGRSRRPGRFGTSGHTKHGDSSQRATPPPAPPPPYGPPYGGAPYGGPPYPGPPYAGPPYGAPPYGGGPYGADPYGAPPYPPDPSQSNRLAPGSYPPPHAHRPYPPEPYDRSAAESAAERYRADPYRRDPYRDDRYRDDPYRDDRYRDGYPAAPLAGAAGSPTGPSVTRAIAERTRYFSGAIKNKVVHASEADGARESGLTALIWNQVMSLAADAMITVALAGTVFFAASGSQQRGNVLQYLLITMAPFAVVAPVIGPLLDRLQHGRRIAMGATGVGRAVLALVMAAHFDDLLVLLPCALGSLVLSKAYAVLRGSAAPRLVPPTMTLVTANARLSIFGLGATAVGGGVLAAFLKVTGSYQWGLRLTAVAFAATALYSFRLPKTVDSPQGGPRPMPISASTVPAAKLLSSARLREWSKRGFGDEVLTTLQAQCSMRGIIGFLTLFLAFYIQQTAHGFDAVLDLTMFAAAAGGASFVGTAIGARLNLGRPETIVILSSIVSGASCVITVLIFGTTMAIVCVAICGVGNALGKLSLDAVVQRDVEESLRSSAFARSETFQQLAWVLGAALAVILPAGHGQLDFLIATLAFGAAVAAVAVRQRTIKVRRAAGRPAAAPYDPGYGPRRSR